MFDSDDNLPPWSVDLKPRKNIAFSSFSMPDPTGDALVNVSMYHRKKFIGNVQYLHPGEGKTAKIVETEILHKYRGKGLGKYMYAQAFEHARAAGLESLRSDTILSEDAQRVWKSMVRRGFAKIQGLQYEVNLRGLQQLNQAVIKSGESAARRVGWLSRVARGARRLTNCL